MSLYGLRHKGNEANVRKLLIGQILSELIASAKIASASENIFIGSDIELNEYGRGVSGQSFEHFGRIMSRLCCQREFDVEKNILGIRDGTENSTENKWEN
jgi:hypothetical protein